ncbi:GDP-mannose 4,6-dehydratase, partial [Candidatus Dependentiae bacterium]|nr:GDP-mannose 4,6-dehydratase [Candidatus Dependentiae bacterium]
DPKSQYAAVIPKFITLVLNNKVPEIYGDGTQSRDFTFIDNVVDANIKAALSPDAPGNVFNVACNERSSINDMVDILSGISGKEINPTFSESRFGDVKHSLADISKARSILKFEPVVKFKDGLEKTFTWFSEKQN